MNLSAFCHAANDDLVPMRQVSRRFIERQCRAGYFLQIGQDKNHCNDKGNKIRNRNCNRNAVDTPNRIEQNHKRNVDYSLAQQGKNNWLNLFSGCLKQGYHKEIESCCQASKTDNLQENTSVMNGGSVINEAFCYCICSEKQQRGARSRDDKTVDEQRAQSRFHPCAIPGRKVISDERECALGHALTHCKRKHIDFFGNAHSRNSLCGICGNDSVEGCVRNRCHH